MPVFSVFIGNSKIEELGDPQCEFEYIYLNKLSMIRNKIVWDRHYSFNRLTMRNNVLSFFNRFTVTFRMQL